MFEMPQPFVPQCRFRKLVEELHDGKGEALKVLEPAEILFDSRADSFFSGTEFFDPCLELFRETVEPSNPPVVAADDGGIHEQSLPVARRSQGASNDRRFRIGWRSVIRLLSCDCRHCRKQLALRRNPLRRLWLIRDLRQ